MWIITWVANSACTARYLTRAQLTVRQRVTELVQFLQDDNAIRDERKKARKNRDKYTGVSSDEFSGYGGGKRNWGY